MDVEGKLFSISGMQSFMSIDGRYSLTVDLPNILSLEGISGSILQSVEWTIDQHPPSISHINLIKEGGFDQQHVTAIEIIFNEEVGGFGLSSIELWKDGLRQPLSQLTLTELSGSEYRFTQFRLQTYYDGNYTLKVKLDGISDLAGNEATGVVEHQWYVKRRSPAAVTDLRISPDLGFSDSDGVTSSGDVTVLMTVNEADTRIRIYQNASGSRTLLADVEAAETGLLTVPINITVTGNFILEAYCVDSFTNESVTVLPLFIDEISLRADWKNVPLIPDLKHPDSLILEFSDRLLDDSILKDNLIWKRNGQVLGKENISILKLSDKVYAVTGMNLGHFLPGNYEMSLDLDLLQKYSSGSPGEITIKAQWITERINNAPDSFYILQPVSNQLIDVNEPVVFQWTRSSDPDNDPVTYSLHIWNNSGEIIISGIEDTIYSLPGFDLKGHSVYNFMISSTDGIDISNTDTDKFNTGNTRPPVASIIYPLAGTIAAYIDNNLIIQYEPNSEKDADGDKLVAIIRLYGPGIDTTITTSGNPGIVYIPSARLQEKQSYIITGSLYDGYEYTAFSDSVSFVASAPTDINDPDTENSKLIVYPNPVHDNALVRYTLDNYSRVMISVYNLSGTISRILFSADQAPGDYTLDFESEDFPSGNYLLQMISKNADGQIKIKSYKFIIIK